MYKQTVLLHSPLTKRGIGFRIHVCSAFSRHHQHHEQHSHCAHSHMHSNMHVRASNFRIRVGLRLVDLHINTYDYTAPSISCVRTVRYLRFTSSAACGLHIIYLHSDMFAQLFAITICIVGPTYVSGRRCDCDRPHSELFAASIRSAELRIHECRNLAMRLCRPMRRWLLASVVCRRRWCQCRPQIGRTDAARNGHHNWDYTSKPDDTTQAAGRPASRSQFGTKSRFVTAAVGSCAECAAKCEPLARRNLYGVTYTHTHTTSVQCILYSANV